MCVIEGEREMNGFKTRKIYLPEYVVDADVFATRRLLPKLWTRKREGDIDRDYALALVHKHHRCLPLGKWPDPNFPKT